MDGIARITPEEVEPRVRSGKTKLVGAFDDPARFEAHRLEGAVSLARYRETRRSWARGTEIVFYCN